MVLHWTIPASFGLDVHVSEVQFQEVVRGDHWDPAKASASSSPSPLYIKRDKDSKIARFLDAELAAQQAVPAVETTPVFGPPYGFTQRQNKALEEAQRKATRSSRLRRQGHDADGNKIAAIKPATPSTRILHSSQGSAFQIGGSASAGDAKGEGKGEGEGREGRQTFAEFGALPVDFEGPPGAGAGDPFPVPSGPALPAAAAATATTSTLKIKNNTSTVAVAVADSLQEFDAGPDTIRCGAWSTIYRNKDNKLKLKTPVPGVIEWRFRVRVDNKSGSNGGWSAWSEVLYAHAADFPEVFTTPLGAVEQAMQSNMTRTATAIPTAAAPNSSAVKDGGVGAGIFRAAVEEHKQQEPYHSAAAAQARAPAITTTTTANANSNSNSNSDNDAYYRYIREDRGEDMEPPRSDDMAAQAAYSAMIAVDSEAAAA